MTYEKYLEYVSLVDYPDGDIDTYAEALKDCLDYIEKLYNRLEDTQNALILITSPCIGNYEN